MVDEVAVERNLHLLRSVCDRSGARCLLALKAFSLYALAPLIRNYLHGTCASGLHEARLGHEEFGGECHVYSAAFTDEEFAQAADFADHIVFNSLYQLEHFCTRPGTGGPSTDVSKAVENGLVNRSAESTPRLGLRVNPLHSEGSNPLYDPCAPGSRLGIPITALQEIATDDARLNAVTGLHFHTLCEQGYEPLDRTLTVIENTLGPHLQAADWVNFGGGHHISQPGYDVDRLVERIVEFSARYGVQVYLEPGEAIAINTGVLVSTVLDLGHNAMDLAILDTSATCHMPDTLEMPYRADIFGAGLPHEYPHTYRLGGQTCLAGDVMGEYSFERPLARGQRLMFDDMSHYTMVKTSTFNGINLPSIAIWNSDTDALRVIRTFGYEDFKTRLS